MVNPAPDLRAALCGGSSLYPDHDGMTAIAAVRLVLQSQGTISGALYDLRLHIGEFRLLCGLEAPCRWRHAFFEAWQGWWIAIAVAMGMLWGSHVSAQKLVKPPPDEEPITYKMVRLSSNKGRASAINRLADGAVEVVGYLRDDSGEVSVNRAHYWMVDSTGNIVWSTNLGAGSSAHDVNNCGAVVGSLWMDSGSRPQLWPNAMSAPIDLPMPDERHIGYATSINDQGVVVGIMQNLDDPDCPGRLVAWKVTVVDGMVTMQGPKIVLKAPAVWGGLQVVNKGFVCATIDVSGYFDPEVSDIRAFRLELGWDEDNVWEVEGTRTQLFDVLSRANGVNEAGSVCGTYYCPTRGHIAYLKTVSGPVLDLPGLPAMKKDGKNYSATNFEKAWALNNATRVQIIGDASRSYTQGNYQHYEGGVPLRWDIDANGVRVVDLRTVTDGSPDLYSVGDINDDGWITSCTRNAGGGPESPVLLIPNR